MNKANDKITNFYIEYIQRDILLNIKNYHMFFKMRF